MSSTRMDDAALRQYLLGEEQTPFQGWDFGHLDGRWQSEPLSWDYAGIIGNFRQDTDALLDMGTGGGEFLLSLGHPHHLTSVTEGWPPNLQLCRERLEPLGITVRPVTPDGRLGFPDEQFDLVINRHESFDAREVFRVLKQGGYFITQQVGWLNNRDLAAKLIGRQPLPCPRHDLANNVALMQNAGFLVLDKREEMPLLKFFDLGAVVYLARQIVWEFPGFGVESHFGQLKLLQEEWLRQGFIASHEHRFLFVVQKAADTGKKT